MNTTNSFTSSSSTSLGGLAWALGLCLLIVAFTMTVAAVVSTRRIAALDPLPAVCWDITKPENCR